MDPEAPDEGQIAKWSKRCANNSKSVENGLRVNKVNNFFFNISEIHSLLNDLILNLKFHSLIKKKVLSNDESELRNEIFSILR